MYASVLTFAEKKFFRAVTVLEKDKIPFFFCFLALLLPSLFKMADLNPGGGVRFCNLFALISFTDII